MEKNNLEIRLAYSPEIKEIQNFFQTNLPPENVWNPEYLCPLGVKAAVIRNQIVVARSEQQIVGAFRFYFHKRKNNRVSLYQFAIIPAFRGQHLLAKMLFQFRYRDIITLCPSGFPLENYFEKNGWILLPETVTKMKINQWLLPAMFYGETQC